MQVQLLLADASVIGEEVNDEGLRFESVEELDCARGSLRTNEGHSPQPTLGDARVFAPCGHRKL